MNKLLLIKKILERFNLWDFLLDVIKKTPKAQLIKTLSSITEKTDKININKISKELKADLNLKSFIKKFMSRPDLVAEDLKNMSPVELGKLSEAIAKARAESGTQDKDTGAQGQALSSSWLIYGLYTPLNNKSGTISITTIQGKSYFFPKPIKLSTWERMKTAQGRNGSGAGQIFWDEYWHKLKGKQPTPGTATVFKLLELNTRKNRAKKVQQNTQKEIKGKLWKTYQKTTKAYKKTKQVLKKLS